MVCMLRISFTTAMTREFPMTPTMIKIQQMISIIRSISGSLCWLCCSSEFVADVVLSSTALKTRNKMNHYNTDKEHHGA